MRMRRKKNVPQKLAAMEYLQESSALGEPLRLFEREAPLGLEIGMGKGGFLSQMARRHPEWNFLGIDRSDMVILKSRPHLEGLSNVRVMIGNMEELGPLFPAESVEAIFLNFSDPWPKERHFKRRLTYRDYLVIYRRILKKGAMIHFKTDNENLFRFSLQELALFPGRIYDVTEDLHQDSAYHDNLPTEYEEKFSAMGFSIYGFRYEKEL